MTKIQHTLQIPVEYAGKRLDQALALLFSEYSRERLKHWIQTEEIRVDDRPAKPKDKLHGGETIVIQAELPQITRDEPEAIPLDILHEDEDLIVLNKPVGLVVHPGAGNHQGTLLNALLHHCKDVGELPRAGIIHRLDKDTSGVMVIAKSLLAYHDLVKQLQARTMSREYVAIVQGELIAGGKVEAPVGRHPQQRIKMAVTPKGKPAVTHYRILEKFPYHTYLHLTLETGRTHQIRVHMAHIHHPIVGDPVYANRTRLRRGMSDVLVNALQQFKRQALHAKRLAFLHPRTKSAVEFFAPLPDDLLALLDCLRNNTS